jgi:hypothetical protein
MRRRAAALQKRGRAAARHVARNSKLKRQRLTGLWCMHVPRRSSTDTRPFGRDCKQRTRGYETAVAEASGFVLGVFQWLMIEPISTPARGVGFHAHGYKPARRLRLEKLSCPGLSRSSNGHFKPLPVAVSKEKRPLPLPLREIPRSSAVTKS